MRLENTHIEHTEVEERRKTFILDTAEDHEKNCFSDNVRQCNIAFSVAHVQVCFKS